MSKLAIDKVFICGLKSDGKKILDLLQRAGVVQIKEEDLSDLGANPVDLSINKASYDKYVKLCDDTLELLEPYKEDDKSSILEGLSNPKSLNLEYYNDRIAQVKETIQKANKATSISKEISENKALIPKLENKISQLKVWENVDIPLCFEGTENTRVFIGSLKGEYSQDEVYKLISENLDVECINYLDITVLSSNKEMTCIMVVTINQFGDRVEEVLKKLEYARSPLTSIVPREEIQRINNEILETQNKIEQLEKDLASYVQYIDDLRFARDYYAMRSDKYEAVSKIPTTQNAYFISGYVLRNYSSQLVEKINNEVNAYVEIQEPNEDEDVPVVLHNGFFASPMETVVESYSLPNKDEIDPSKVVSLFYYLLFGLMLSDAGYGLLLFLGTGILLLTVKDMKPGLKKMMKLFFYGGISTMIWGILFGSFFGDAIDVIAHKFCGVPSDQAVLVPFLQKLHLYWFDPVSLPMKLLMFSFLLGIIHLITGLLIKGYMLLKQGAYKDFVFDVIFWLMFVLGGIGAALGMDMVASMIGEGFSVPQSVSKVSTIVMLIGAIGVVLTGGRESRNWFKRLLKGAYAAYGITGWLSDILSYSRLLALGLATGIIAQVFNKMGSMIDVPFLGLIIFIIVFIVGHLLNLGINVLGAYVHTNRLQFVEFFGKFYSGGGKAFTPFTENTKYYQIKEDK